MMGIKRGWFNESYRHSLAAKGISSSNQYFVRKRRRIELSESNRYATFRGDLLGERDRLRELAASLKEAARRAQERKEGADPEARAALERIRSSLMAQRGEVKEQLRDLNRRIGKAEEEGELDPEERKKLLEEDRERIKRNTERAIENELGAKFKATRARGLVLQERAAIDREKRRLGLKPIMTEAENEEFRRMFGEYPTSGRTTVKVAQKRAEKERKKERDREKKAFMDSLPSLSKKTSKDKEISEGDAEYDNYVKLIIEDTEKDLSDLSDISGDEKQYRRDLEAVGKLGRKGARVSKKGKKKEKKSSSELVEEQRLEEGYEAMQESEGKDVSEPPSESYDAGVVKVDGKWTFIGDK